MFWWIIIAIGYLMFGVFIMANLKTLSHKYKIFGSENPIIWPLVVLVIIYMSVGKILSTLAYRLSTKMRKTKSKPLLHQKQIFRDYRNAPMCDKCGQIIKEDYEEVPKL